MATEGGEKNDMNWYVTKYTEKIKKGAIFRMHNISRAQTDLAYVERSVFKKTQLLKVNGFFT